MAVGYDNVDVAAATERGVVVTNTPGVLTDATADLAMALILMVTRRLGEGERLIRSGQSWSWDMFFLLGTSLAGKTLGVIGLGAIGQATARRAHAFGMEIVYAGPRRASEETEAELGGARRVPLDAAAGERPTSSPCTRRSRPTTRHLIDSDGAEADALRRLPHQHGTRPDRRRSRPREGPA